MSKGIKLAAAGVLVVVAVTFALTGCSQQAAPGEVQTVTKTVTAVGSVPADTEATVLKFASGEPANMHHWENAHLAFKYAVW